MEKTARSRDSDQSAGMQMILNDTLIAYQRAAEGAVRSGSSRVANFPREHGEMAIIIGRARAAAPQRDR